jgi:protein-S-isoprenylcysteine O-methyltransferase Ste14
MLKIFQSQNGMNIIGQGIKILLFALPFAIAAVMIHVRFPDRASLPTALTILKPAGYLFLALGFVLWLISVIQLLKDFPKGKLITTGAYGVCRNPLYSSFIVGILPGIALLTWTWVYFPVSVALYVGVVIFITKEEEKLLQVFGQEYRDYQARVHRIIPFI